MFEWWTYLSIGMTLWVIGLSVWILFERRSPVSTLAWIFGLSVLPVIGIAVYFVIGPRRFDRKKLRRRFAQEATARARRRERTTDPDVAHTAYHLMELCEHAAGASAHPRLAGVEIYTGGREKYAAMLEAIEGATHHIHFEYYIWNPDEIGTRIRDALVGKAKAGIEVRVLIDAFGSGDANKRFWRPLLDEGGEVCWFNRLSLRRLKSRLANFRTHRKILVVDGVIGFTGGMNISEYHSEEFREENAWRDTHCRLEGPGVRGLQVVFCEGWHYATGAGPEGDVYFPNCEAPEQADVVQVVCSGPDERKDAIHKLYFSSIAGANHRVYLSTAYFVPDAIMMAALSSAALRGADVRVLVPAKSDVKIVEAAARSYYRELLDIGVRIFEYGPPMLHTKTCVVDDYLAIIGTANADARSFKLNFEVVMANYDAETCEQMVEIFVDDLDRATEVDEETLDSYRFRTRLYQNFARLLSPVL